jgi:hypothetical protein
MNKCFWFLEINFGHAIYFNTSLRVFHLHGESELSDRPQWSQMLVSQAFGSPQRNVAGFANRAHPVRPPEPRNVDANETAILSARTQYGIGFGCQSPDVPRHVLGGSIQVLSPQMLIFH